LLFPKTNKIMPLNKSKQPLGEDVRPDLFQRLTFKIRNNRNASLVMTCTAILLIFSAFFFFLWQEEYHSMHLEQIANPIGHAMFWVGLVLLGLNAIYFSFILYRYFKYRAIESVTDEELPTVTVIVPAYNEGKQVYATLISLAESDYPQEKLQLLSIDDGSKDDTWYWMQKAKLELGDRVKISQQPKNMGKRHALYRGFNEGNGEVFVTVDSDSIVKFDTLRNLVSPFIATDNCGAVAGNIRVLNNKKALLPKMLDVSFALSFEFVRSAESSLNSVLCTPGALAAYKRESVFNCLDKWINQTFMGNPSDIGEDRALTNMILSQGKKVLFQRNAYAYTNVPETYEGLYKMFIRWGRSNVRENIEMSKYVFTNFKSGSKIGTRVLFLKQSLTILMSYPGILLMFLLLAWHPLLVLSATLCTILLFSTFPTIFYAKRHNISSSFWAYSYSVLYTFGLFWITPYAIATAGKSGWLTRSLPQPA